jgi:hypothetical protein
MGAVPVAPGGGSIGGEAADWGLGTGGKPVTNCGLTLVPLLNMEGKEFVLRLGDDHADVIVILGNLDDFGSILGSRTLHLILGLCSRILPMNSFDQKIILGWKCCIGVHMLLFLCYFGHPVLYS